MSSLEEYANNQTNYQPARTTSEPHPKGWEPGVAWDGHRGTITSRPTTERAPDWNMLLASWGFDPERFSIIEPVQVRTWEAVTKEGIKQLWYYRANIVAAHDTLEQAARELAKEIRKPRPHKPPPKGESALIVALADWQMGKHDGDGMRGTVDRVLATYDDALLQLARLGRQGHKIGSLYLCGMGDLLEGCGEQYATQTFTVEADRRAQARTVRRLLAHGIERLAPKVERLVVTAVGGNHGENRRNNKAYTTSADNDDVAIFEQIADAFRGRADYQNVSFVLPEGELSITLDAGGMILGLAHGHQARTVDAIWRWWEGQALGRRSAGDADVLITGHYHHLRVREDSGRLHLQCPALDGGSDWFAEKTGRVSRAGTLSIVLSSDGWSDLQILGRR